MPTGTAAREASRFRRTHLCGQLEGNRSPACPHVRSPRGFWNPAPAPPTEPWAGFSLVAEHRTTLDWNAGSFRPRCFRMSSDPIVDALRLAHGLVWQNLRPTTDAATVSQLRDLVHSPSVRSALERSGDTLPAFALREVTRALSDQSQTHGRDHGASSQRSR